MPSDDVNRLPGRLSQALFIARKDIAYTLREPINLMWLFVMPVIFFFFIGTTTGGGGFSPLSADTPLVVETDGEPGVVLERLQNRLVEYRFDIYSGEGEAPPRRLVVPAGIDATLPTDTPVMLQYVPGASDLTAQYDLLRLQRATLTVLADLAIADMRAPGDRGAGLAELDAQPRNLTVDVAPAGRRLEIPSGFEQAIPGMMVMFTLIVLLTSGSVTLMQERKLGLLRRLAATPIPRGWVVAGKWGGKLMLGLVQIAFAMIAGTVLFGMHWGPDLVMVVLVLFAWGAFCASVGVVLGSIGNTEGQVAGLGVLTSMLLAALGGCWWPIEVTPPFMQAMQKFLPSGWAMDAMHKLISFENGAASAVPHLIALLLAALLAGWIAKHVFRFE